MSGKTILETLKELGLDEETLKKAEASEDLKKYIPQAENLEKLIEALPESLKSEYKDKMRDMEKAGAKMAKDQLYETLEAQKKELAKLTAKQEKDEADKKKKEEDELKKKKEDEDKSKPADEKLTQLSAEFKKDLDSISATSAAEIQKLNRSLQASQNTNLREKLISSKNLGSLATMIPIPTDDNPLTPELLTAAAESAEAAFKKIQEDFTSEADKKKKKEEEAKEAAELAARGLPPSQGGGTPAGSSHLRGQETPINTKELVTAGKAKLEQAKDDMYKKYGFK